MRVEKRQMEEVLTSYHHDKQEFTTALQRAGEELELARADRLQVEQRGSRGWHLRPGHWSLERTQQARYLAHR